MSSPAIIKKVGYTRDALKGVSWLSGNRFINRGITFVKIIVLARVLSPAQFGIFGIATLILSLLEILTETGINVVLIQSREKIDSLVNSAWVISIIRGCIISLLLIILAPFISLFFNTPEVKGIIYFFCTIPLVRGFINPAIINFQKELDFDKEFLFRSSIFLFDAAVAITLALITHSVYSLGWGMIAGALLELYLSFKVVKLIPRFLINKKYFLDIFHKGKWITANGIINYIAQEGDSIILGKMMGATYLGIYQMAYKISTLPISEVTDVVGKVVFPVFVKIEQDRKRLLTAFIKTLIITFTISFLVGTIIFLFPKEIILILLGEKWLEALPILQVLVVYGVLRTIAGPASALFLSIGKQQYVTVMTFARLFALTISIYPLIKIYGFIGAGYSVLLSVIFETPFIIYFIVKAFRRY